MDIGRGVIAATVLSLMASIASAQPRLTGITEFSVDSGGNASGGQVWNTLGGGGVWNVYVIPGPAGGAFVNSDDGANMAISIPLTIGTHTFTLHTEYSGNFPTMGLNLFLDSGNTSPAISVFGQTGVGGGAPTGGTTYSLSGSTVTGANATSVTTENGYRVTLSDYLYTMSGGTDRVSSHDDAPSGSNDNLVTFTLTVEYSGAVSTLSPTGVAALALLLAVAALVALRRLG